MAIYEQLVFDGQIDRAGWDEAAATRSPVGMCSCGSVLYAEPADTPPHSEITYFEAECREGHELVLPRGAVRRTIPSPIMVRDFTEPQERNEY